VDGTYYTGSTWDLDQRIREHDKGEGAEYTRKRLPIKLVYMEEYPQVEDAYRRERQLHGWSHRKKQALIDGNMEALVNWSKKDNSSSPG